MVDTKELEYQIFACILLNPKVLDEECFDEKFFKHRVILNYFKKCYWDYGCLDIKILTQGGKNEKVMQLIFRLLDIEISWTNIYGYYKQLKEAWRSNSIELIATQFKNKKIEYNEFAKKMFEITNYDFDDQALLTPDAINEFESAEREYTDIDELDYLLKGIEYGKLSLFSGITNHGKTTLMIQFARNLIKKHKKIFYFSGEQTASEFKNFLYVGMCTKEQLDFVKDSYNSRIYDVKPKQQVLNYLNQLHANDFVVYNNDVIQNDIEQMIKTMKKAFNKGIRIFFIDNFMQLDNSEKLEEQTKIVEMFKRFAMKNNVIVCLVAHPRKTQFMKSRLTIFDIAGTQNIANKSANICTIMRTDLLGEVDYAEVKKGLSSNGYDIEKCDAAIEVLKTKGNSCKMVGLKYNKEVGIYYETPKSSKEELEQKSLSETKKRRNESYE